MKQILLYSVLILAAAFVSCEDENTDKRKQDSALGADSVAAPLAEQVVKNDSALKDSLNKALDTLPPEVPTFRKKFKVYYTTSYCGGAKPPDEVIQQHQTPRLLTNSNLKLKEHFTGVVYTLSTNASGEGEVELLAGKYDVYFTQNINASLNTGFDAKCSTWVNKMLFTTKVTEDSNVQEITVHFECNPCDVNSKKRP